MAERWPREWVRPVHSERRRRAGIALEAKLMEEGGAPGIEPHTAEVTVDSNLRFQRSGDGMPYALMVH